MSAQRILVIERDADLRSTIHDVLVDLRCEVVAVSTLEAAFEEIAKSDFSLVLCDSFRETHNRRNPQTAELVRRAAPAPVGLMTGFRNADATGFAFTLEKPFVLERLVEQVTLLSKVPLHAVVLDRVVAYFAALSSADWDGLAALCSEDVEYSLPSDDRTFGRVVTGRGAFRDFARETFASFPDARFTVADLLPLPAGAIARYSSTWRGGPDNISGAVLFQLDGAHIHRISSRLDLARLVG